MENEGLIKERVEMFVGALFDPSMTNVIKTLRVLHTKVKKEAFVSVLEASGLSEEDVDTMVCVSEKYVSVSLSHMQKAWLDEWRKKPQEQPGAVRRVVDHTDGEKPTERKNGRNNVTVVEPFTDLINDIFNKEKVVAWLRKHIEGKPPQRVAAFFTVLVKNGVLHDYPNETTFRKEFLSLIAGKTIEGVARYWRMCDKRESVLSDKERRARPKFLRLVERIEIPDFR